MLRALMPIRNYLIPLALILIIALGFQFSYAQNEESQDGEFIDGELIVKVHPDADPEALEQDLEADGNTIVETIPELGVVVVEVPQNVPVSSAEAAIAEDPDVEYVEKNYIVHADVTPNDSGYNFQSSYFNVVDAPQAWDNMTGDADVVIAVLDTGVRSTHQDIGKLVPGCNTLGSFNENSCGSDTGDVHGHGSGVAGTAAALTNNGTGAAGMCWGCSVMPVKVLSDSGSGPTTDVVQGILYATNYAINNPTKRVIINMSLGRTCSGISSLEQDAINLAWNNNVLVVTSAGNSGNDNTQCPASAANAIAVSATTTSDTLAGFSSFGNFVDLAAPGVSIYNVRGTGNSSYTFWSGTSFSSPNVAGIAGLIWSANPSLTNAQVDQILRNTADNIGSSYFFGDGRVNADKAVDAALGGGGPLPTPPPPSPTSPPSTPPPPSGGDAVLSQFDPGNSGTNTIQVTGAPPGALVKLEFSFSDGTKVISGGVCDGQVLNLGSSQSLGQATADGSGKATFNVYLRSRSFSGKTMHVQARVETGVCDITNKIVQVIDGSSPPPTPPPPTPPPSTPPPSTPPPSTPPPSTPPPSTPPPPSGGDAVLSQFDPGNSGTNTIQVTGAPPGALVKLEFSFSDGTKVISGGVCDGQVLNLGSSQSLGQATADGSGKATFNVYLRSRSFSGKTMHVQARVETGVCDITNKIVQVIDGSSPPPTPPPPTPPPSTPPPPTPPPPTPPPSTPPPSTPPPPSGGDAVLSQFDPGNSGTNTIQVTGAPPGALVKLEFSFSDGTKVISGGVCDGQVLNLGSSQSLGQATADGSGKATFNVYLRSRSFSGKTMHVQARVETGVCDITNKIVQVIDGSSPPPTPPPSTPPPPTPDPNPPIDIQTQMLNLVNEARSQSRNCGSTFFPAAPAVNWDDRVENAAIVHSQDMAQNEFLDHTGSDGSSAGDRLLDQGYNWNAWGENILVGSDEAADAINGWLNSPDHCSAIMNPTYDEVGAGTAQGVYNGVAASYWTLVFGSEF